MSTLRISNIEAKSVPASPTLDEKVKITNSTGDVLVHVDGKTSGITTIGINTTASNITFDANSNVILTGIITASSFSGDGSNLTGIDASALKIEITRANCPMMTNGTAIFSIDFALRFMTMLRYCNYISPIILHLYLLCRTRWCYSMIINM